jgi:hypothetical protein
VLSKPESHEKRGCVTERSANRGSCAAAAKTGLLIRDAGVVFASALAYLFGSRLDASIRSVMRPDTSSVEKTVQSRRFCIGDLRSVIADLEIASSMRLRVCPVERFMAAIKDRIFNGEVLLDRKVSNRVQTYNRGCSIRGEPAVFHISKTNMNI